MALFDSDDLRRRGFGGFLPVSRLYGPNPPELPVASGVYAVVCSYHGPPAVLERSGGGRWKKKDPTVPPERLEHEWIDEAQTLYIGKAASLRERVGLLLDFGRGAPVMHWGGRLLWQVERCEEFLVAWREDYDFAGVETDLIDEFLAHFGHLPFANLKRGARRRG